ncbi:MAG: tetratricopeptide repeat-containing sensor histidine kinase [Candidatus Zophobacter franzmannii]|nr:tetratricopeptide repeat-containing sensor histidine kinase [Candidatus Zophobacter franzmannii]
MNKELRKKIEDELRALTRESKYEEAITLAGSFLEVYEDSSPELVNVIRIITGNSYFGLSEYSKAIPWYEAVLKNQDQETEDIQMGRAYLGKGGCKFHSNLNADAEECFKKSLAYFETSNYQLGLGFVYNWLGIVYNEQKQLFKSLDMNVKALNICKELDNPFLAESTLNSIGLLYYALGDDDKAIEYFEDGLKENERAKNLTLRADIFNNIGMVHGRLHDYSKSKDFYANALEIRQKYFPNDYKRLGHTLSNLALSESETGELDKAWDHTLLALENYSKLPDPHKLFQLVYCNLADISLKKGNLEQTKEYLEKYEKLRNEYNISQFEDFHFRIKSNYYFELKDFSKALEYKSKYSEAAIASAKSFSKKIVENFQMRIDYEKKKIETEIYKVKNEELALANKAKDKFLSVVAHDLRGPIANIVDILKLLVEEDGSIPANDKANIFKEILSDTQSTYSLLQNLLSWSHNIMQTVNINRETFSVKNLIDEIVDQSRSLIRKKAINVTVSVESDKTIESDRNMVAFIIRNLLSNALKFTPDNGQVEVRATWNENKLEIAVKDDGVGIPENLLESIFDFAAGKSTLGTANEKGTGLGLLLCKDFASLNNAKISVKSDVDKGSVFTLTINID